MIYDNHWNCQLPVKGSENSSFLKMNIEFGPFADGDYLRDAKLPNDWQLVELNKHWYNIIDNKKRVRAKVFIKKENSFMYPERRFAISIIENNNSVNFVVIDNDNNSKIFDKKVILPERSRFSDAYKQKLNDQKNNQFCENWLNEHFPNWDDYNAYWDDEIDIKLKENL